MKLLNLFTALTLSSLSFAAIDDASRPSGLGAAAKINVICLRAAGYYGAVRIKQVGDEVNIDVKSGLKLNPGNFLQELQVEVPPGHVMNVRITVPASSCEVAGPAILTCMASTVKATYYLDGNVEHSVELAGVTVQLAKVVTTTVHGTLREIEATIVGERPVGNTHASSAMLDRFGAPGAPVHSACSVE